MEVARASCYLPTASVRACLGKIGERGTESGVWSGEVRGSWAGGGSQAGRGCGWSHAGRWACRRAAAGRGGRGSGGGAGCEGCGLPEAGEGAEVGGGREEGPLGA